MIQPVTSKNVSVSFVVGAVLVATLILLEYGQPKINGLEKLITGTSRIVIENRTIKEIELAKLRLTVNQLDMRLRQNNITSIGDVHFASHEPSGQLGFTLK